MRSCTTLYRCVQVWLLSAWSTTCCKHIWWYRRLCHQVVCFPTAALYCSATDGTSKSPTGRRRRRRYSRPRSSVLYYPRVRTTTFYNGEWSHCCWTEFAWSAVSWPSNKHKLTWCELYRLGQFADLVAASLNDLVLVLGGCIDDGFMCLSMKLDEFVYVATCDALIMLDGTIICLRGQ